MDVVDITITVCLETHILSHRGVPLGITVCRPRECLQASAVEKERGLQDPQNACC